MRLVDLLEGAPDVISVALDIIDGREPFPESMTVKRKGTPIDRAALLLSLQAIIRQPNTGAPPALHAVAKELRTSVGALRHHFSSLCDEIVSRHERHVADAHRERMLACRREALAFVSEMSTKLGVQLSRKHALREIRAKTGLPKNPLRREIAEVFSTLGIE